MWEELYEKHYKELLHYAVAACKNLAEAEDAAQEVFLKALQNPDTFQDLGPSQKRAWLFRTLKNLMCDRYRRGQLENAYLAARQEQAEYWDPASRRRKTGCCWPSSRRRTGRCFTFGMESALAAVCEDVMNIGQGGGDTGLGVGDFFKGVLGGAKELLDTKVINAGDYVL